MKFMCQNCVLILKCGFHYGANLLKYEKFLLKHTTLLCLVTQAEYRKKIASERFDV